jgi:hypothetical protein
LKKKIYSEYKIVIPDWLDEEKLKVIVTSLHEQTIRNITKLKDSYKINSEEKLQILAEYLAFDQIFKDHKIDKETIEQSLISFNLTITYS